MRARTAPGTIQLMMRRHTLSERRRAWGTARGGRDERRVSRVARRELCGSATRMGAHEWPSRESQQESEPWAICSCCWMSTKGFLP